MKNLALAQILNRFCRWLESESTHPDAWSGATNREFCHDCFLPARDALLDSGGNLEDIRELAPDRTFNEGCGVYSEDLLWAEDKLNSVY